jgi:hypothetical protein
VSLACTSINVILSNISILMGGKSTVGCLAAVMIFSSVVPNVQRGLWQLFIYLTSKVRVISVDC